MKHTNKYSKTKRKRISRKVSRMQPKQCNCVDAKLRMSRRVSWECTICLQLSTSRFLASLLFLIFCSAKNDLLFNYFSLVLCMNDDQVMRMTQNKIRVSLAHSSFELSMGMRYICNIRFPEIFFLPIILRNKCDTHLWRWWGCQRWT